MLSEADEAALRSELAKRGKTLLSCEASAELVARREGSLLIAREFFNTLGITRDPNRAMG